MSDLQYSPKLRNLIDQIDTLIKEEGVCGAIMLYDNDLKVTEYSLKTLEHKQNAITITDGQFILSTKDSSFSTSKKKKIENTVNMLISMQDLCGNYYMAFETIMSEVKKKFNVSVTKSENIKRDGPSQGN